MATYVTLIRWTDQGIKDVKNTITRAQQGQRGAELVGGKILSMYWTQGAYDAVLVSEFPDDETAAAFFLRSGQEGTFHTQTMRAFNLEDMQRIIQKMP